VIDVEDVSLHQCVIEGVLPLRKSSEVIQWVVNPWSSLVFSALVRRLHPIKWDASYEREGREDEERNGQCRCRREKGLMYLIRERKKEEWMKMNELNSLGTTGLGPHRLED
jgi:hypothetical protein